MTDQFPYDVFLSHSSKDKAIVRPVAERLRGDGLRVWLDEWEIRAGDSIPAKLEEGLERSRVLVLCMSANAFGSDWSQLEGHTFRFKDPLNKERRLIPLRLDDAPIKGSLAQFLYIDWSSNEREQAYNRLLDACRLGAKPLALTQVRISIARLPTSGREIFGRVAELQLLDEAWANPKTNIVTFVAWGGVGKTALVNHWLKHRLARDNYGGAERVYGWSFFSQGTSERAASADLFIDQALRWFGDEDSTEGSPWDKGERLAGYIRQGRTLLILDGLEPLQHPPGSAEGQLKDTALQALLVELAAHQPGLCIISTRERVGDLVEFEDGTVVQHELEYLSPQAGAQIFRSFEVKGNDDELEEASRELGGHAFSLTLLGSYLNEVLDGDIRRRKEIENLFEDTRHGNAAQRMIAAYEKWLCEGLELALLRLLGLFDRPADLASIVALREAPVIPGLTEALQHCKGREWSQAVARLRRLKLLGEALPNEPGTLDAHPLIREHFKQQLKGMRPDAWREGNNRLYQHLRNTAKDLPNTVEEMSPLYAAVAHGCAADRHQEVLNEVFQKRIQRGDPPFSIHHLGAFGANLAMLSGFFETRWQETVAGLTQDSQAFVLTAAGFCLNALGRLEEAVQTIQAGQQINFERKDWENAAKQASNLSDLYLTIGDLAQALRLAKQGVELADGGDVFQRMTKRISLANALHEAGFNEEAAAAFSEAEEMQKQLEPEYPLLYSLQGFQYCDLLLDQGQVKEVKERGEKMFEWRSPYDALLTIALDNLLLGRVMLVEAEEAGTTDVTQAEKYLQGAMDGLREAGNMTYLPLGLLARAKLHRINANFERAQRDLREVLRIAERSRMGLHLADYHLESGRLQLAQGSKEKAREHWATAKEMVERMGYHRRDNEVNEIAKQLS